MKKLCLLIGTLLSVCTVACGKIQLPGILNGNMVLQQNTSVKLWGKATPDVKVTVYTSWDKKKCQVRSDADGNWLAVVETPKADYTVRYIDVSDGETVRIDNVLIGEVWFCSGQSNMEMPLGGFLDASTQGGNEVIAASRLKKGIRVATIKKEGAHVPQDTCAGSWAVCSPENAPKFSAVGYYFAERLNQILDVPVGIINCSWSGSHIECWLPREVVEEYKDVDLSKADFSNRRHFHAGVPVIMYNGMLTPLMNYTIKGFLWYQGEANVKGHACYADRMVTLVNRWREDWGLGDLPFYMAEIAPFEYAGVGEDAAFLREAQYKATARLSNCGIVCTNDLVSPDERKQIHPCRKREVGDRFAYMALNRDYGYKDVACDSPVYKEMTVEDSVAIISFDHVSGFSSYCEYTGFEVAGEDRVFHPAQAKTDYRTRTVSVWSEAVKKPVAVRYCFRNFQLGNLKTNRGLPFAPFRTDDFPPATN